MKGLALGSLALPLVLASDSLIPLSFTTRREACLEGLFRRSTGPEYIFNHYSYYDVEIEVGSPPQSVNVTLDTGSADLWLSDYDFHPDASSSFHKNESTEPFRTKYGDGREIHGFWGTDDVTIGGLAAKGLSLGVANTSSQSILGIGFQQSEATVRTIRDGALFPTYLNLPAVLREQGQIKRVAYSLYLTDSKSEKGEIMFGGVDHAKYSDDNLTLIPVVNDQSVKGLSQPPTLSVMLHGVDIAGARLASAFSVLLDAGSTFSYLPSEVLNIIASATSATYEESLKMYTVDCSTSTSIAFNFSGAYIDIPLRSTLTPIVGSDSCALGFLPTENSGGRCVFGDTVLRSLYVVYDLEGTSVALGRSNDTDSQEVEEIASDVPRATSAPYYWATTTISDVTTLATPTGSVATSSQQGLDLTAY